MRYELYLVINNLDNKKYVGQTSESVGYKKRWQIHVKESLKPRHKTMSYFHKCIKLYGPENFTIKRLMHNIDEKDIDRLECLWIEKFNTFYKNGNGYNMTYGGQGIHGYKHTEITKDKLSKLSKGRSISPEVIKQREITKRTNGYYNYRRNETNWRHKLSLAAKERYKYNDNPFKGKHHTDESKTLISNANGSKVYMLDISSDEILKTFNSAMLAGNYLRELGITNNKTPNCRILAVCKGKAQTAYGYKWKFVECID